MLAQGPARSGSPPAARGEPSATPGFAQGPGGETAAAGSVLRAIQGPSPGPGLAPRAAARDPGAQSSGWAVGVSHRAPPSPLPRTLVKSPWPQPVFPRQARDVAPRHGAGTKTGLLSQDIVWGQNISLRWFPHLAAIPCSPESLVICRKGRSLCRLGSDSQQGSRACDAHSVSQQTFIRQPLLWPDAGLGAGATAVS